METTRQQKIARQIQRDMAEILQQESRTLLRGVMVTVTAVRMSPDLGYARIYVSIFPYQRSDETMAVLEANQRQLRGQLGNRIRNQVRSVPELKFFLDDSLEYIEQIERAVHPDR